MFASGKTAAVASAANYIEDVFSTYLYTGTGSSQTITNSIDLSTKGGLVWIKGRSGATGHRFTDTARGVTKSLASNSTAAQVTESTGLTAFNTTGFTIGADADYNTSADTYASWTLREQPKFFDVVTFTTEASNTNQRISHSLGSVPGMIIVKRTDGVDNWFVWHRSLPTTTDDYLYLNTTAATQNTGGAWGTTGPTSTDFGVDDNFFGGNRAMVAYIFAHNAGGFGLTGTDNVISCGSLTTDGSGNATVSLGYEPQWVLMKKTSGAEGWMLFDNMRGLLATQGPAYSRKLVPNLTNAESDGNECSASSTGFNVGGVVGGATYVYVAIRRGPMKVPTSGTSVYTANNAGSGVQFTAGFPPDMVLSNDRTGSSTANGSRLIGPSLYLETNTTSAETSRANAFFWNDPTNKFTNDIQSFSWVFRRAPSFFDVVCYTGTGSSTNVTHNLGAVPEMMIVRNRNIGDNWVVYHSALGNATQIVLNETTASSGSSAWNSTTPTSTVFRVGTSGTVNGSGRTYVAYLFATCVGVSKVGSYTGTGALQTVNCGFTSGARFVLIKRTDSTGDWWTYDSARGITSGNDPYLFLNSTAAEVTSTNYVDTDSTGFKVTAAAPAALNASGGTYIFLAIA